MAVALPQALARAGLSQADIDFWEINQAFSVVDLVNQRLLGLSNSRVNVHGGAVALGERGGRVWLSSLADVKCCAVGLLVCAADDGRAGVLYQGTTMATESVACGSNMQRHNRSQHCHVAVV